jgi:hypothetical protein
VQLDRNKDREAHLRVLKGKEKALLKKQAQLRDFLLEETDPGIKEGFKGDLHKNTRDLEETRADIDKIKALIGAENGAVLLMPEFIETMDKAAQIIASTKNMTELDFYIKKIFSNFQVGGKNVVSATLSEPFSRLTIPEGTIGAP